MVVVLPGAGGGQLSVLADVSTGWLRRDRIAPSVDSLGTLPRTAGDHHLWFGAAGTAAEIMTGVPIMVNALWGDSPRCTGKIGVLPRRRESLVVTAWSGRRKYSADTEWRVAREAVPVVTVRLAARLVNPPVPDLRLTISSDRRPPWSDRLGVVGLTCTPARLGGTGEVTVPNGDGPRMTEVTRTRRHARRRRG